MSNDTRTVRETVTSWDDVRTTCRYGVTHWAIDDCTCPGCTTDRDMRYRLHFMVDDFAGKLKDRMETMEPSEWFTFLCRVLSEAE